MDLDCSSLTIQYDVYLRAGLELCVLLLGNHQVLQVLALWPAQHLRVVHIEQSPHVVRGLGDADGCIAGLHVGRRVLIRHLEPVCDPEAIKAVAVFHTDSADLRGDGTRDLKDNR